MATLNPAFGPVIFVNMTMAFYFLPWSLSQKRYLFTVISLLASFALQVWTLFSTYSLPIAIICAGMLLALSYAAAMHLGVKRWASRASPEG